jgi:hypothetical protein
MHIYDAEAFNHCLRLQIPPDRNMPMLKYGVEWIMLISRHMPQVDSKPQLYDGTQGTKECENGRNFPMPTQTQP